MNEPIRRRRAARATRSADAANTSRTPAHCARSRRRCAGLRDVGHAPRDRDRDDERGATEPDEDRPPCRDAQRASRAASSQQRAQAAGDHDPARRAAPGARADTTSRCAFSGAIRHAHTPSADHRARDDESRQRSGIARKRARRRRRPPAAPARRAADRSGRAACPPGSCISAERQEVRAGEQPERRRIERQLARQVRRDHRVDDAEHVRQEIARRRRRSRCEANGSARQCRQPRKMK